MDCDAGRSRTPGKLAKFVVIATILSSFLSDLGAVPEDLHSFHDANARSQKDFVHDLVTESPIES